MGLLDFLGVTYDGLCKRGAKAADDNDFKGAAALYEKAIAKDASRPEAYHDFGQTVLAMAREYLARGDRSRGLKTAEHAIKLFDQAIGRRTEAHGKARSLYHRGQAQAILGRTGERDKSWAEADKLDHEYMKGKKPLHIPLAGSGKPA